MMTMNKYIIRISYRCGQTLEIVVDGDDKFQQKLDKFCAKLTKESVRMGDRLVGVHKYFNCKPLLINADGILCVTYDRQLETPTSKVVKKDKKRGVV